MPDIDWGQVIFLILFVVVGFVRWLGNLMEQRKEAKERASLSPEELARREAAWRRQVGQDENPPPLPTPTSTQPPPDPFRQFKELIEQLQTPEQPPKRPSTPPPPVQRPLTPPPIPQRAATVAPAPPQAAPITANFEKAFPTSSSVNRSFTEAIAHRERGTADSLRSLRKSLRNPEALRQAFVVREILGPPKALE